MGDVAAVRQHIEDVVARIQADNKYHEAHSTGNDLLQKVETEVLREFLAVDNSEQSSSGFKTKTTVGVMFANGVIDNMVVGGPAYNSRQLDKGDVVVDIDGKMVTSDNLSQLLVGSDIAGTPVTITVKKGSKTGVKKTVTLLRMPSEDIADRRRLFELFTAMKARATLPRGRETMEGMIDNAIELWTRMTIADSERDAKARERVAAMQERSKRILAEAVQNDEVKKLLYLQRHDDALGLKASFDQLDDAAKQAQVETARLTLALKEAEGEIIDLRADNVKLKDTVQSLEDQLRDARAAVAKLEADAEGIMSEFDACRNKGMGDSKEIEKLKRELAMQESTIKKQHQEKSDLQAQIDQLTRTVTETKQKLSKAVTDAEVAETESLKTISSLKRTITDMENDFQGRLAVLEAAAQELEVRTRTEKDGLLEQLKRANLSLQSSEFERSDMRDRMLRVSEGSQKLLKELDSVTSAGYRALEHEKRNAFLVEEVLGQLQVCKSAHQREREGLVTELYSALQAIQEMHTGVLLPPGILEGGIADSKRATSEDVKSKQKESKGGGVASPDGSGESEVGWIPQPEMTLDMFSEGSMEERDAHAARIFAAIKSDAKCTFLVELPEGFGKGEFAAGNLVFVKKLANEVTANGRALIHALVSLQADLDSMSQRLAKAEERQVVLEKERDTLQKDLNDTRTSLQAQTQRNVELHKAQKQAETQAHDLSIALKVSKDTAAKLSERVDALSSKNMSLGDRLHDVEELLETNTREQDKLRAQVATIKEQLRDAEQKTEDAQSLRKQAEAQLSNLVYDLDKAETLVKQKEVELVDLREQVKKMTASIEELETTRENQESKLMDFKQWLHETKQQLQEVTWRNKSLTEDVASATRREQDLQQSIAEMDSTIMQLEEANNNLSATGETRRRQIEKCNADLARAADDAKQLQLRMQEAERMMTQLKEDHDKEMKAKVLDLTKALSAVEQMHTVVCQPQVGIAKGIGITLEEAEGNEGCKIKNIIKNGVAESEGTLRPGDILEEVDQVNVKGCTFEEVHGLLVGVAGSSVTICGVHAPYMASDTFSAVMVRSGFDCSPAHAMETIEVDTLAEQVLKEAGTLRNALMELKSHNRKVLDKLTHEQTRVSALDAEKKSLKQEVNDARAKYESQVQRALDLTKGKKKVEEDLNEVSRNLEKDRTELRRIQAELKTLDIEHQHLTATAKETGEELLNKKISLGKANENVRELKEEIGQHLRSINEEQTARQKGEVQIAQLAYQLDVAQAKIKNLKDEVKELDIVSAKQKEQISDLKAIVTSREKELSTTLSSIRHVHTNACHRTVGIARGIGMTLYSPEDGVCRIESIIPGGVAEQEGSLQVNDIITEIDRISVRDSTSDEIHELLSGSAGSSVTICAVRGSASDSHDIRAILFRAGIDSGSVDAHELCTEVTEAVESQRSQMATMQNGLKDMTEKYEQLQAEHAREMSRLQSQLDETRGKFERMSSRNSEMQMMLKTTETHLSESQLKVEDLEAQNVKLQQNLQRLTGVHEQHTVSLEEMKIKFTETVKELEELNEKLSRTQDDKKEAIKGRSMLQMTLDEQTILMRKLEKHLDTEQARTKLLHEDVHNVKALVHKREGEITELQSQIANILREKEDAQHTIQTLNTEIKEHVRRLEAQGKDLHDLQAKLTREAERTAELSYALDRAGDLEKKLTRELNDVKRKFDAEIFAKDQTLRREETVKRSLREAREYAADFKVQAEADITNLRKELASICGTSQKTHAKVCGQTVGSAAGVGLFLVDPSAASESVRVESVVPGRSAALDGRVVAGDEILEVDGKDVRLKRADFVNTLLAGEAGSAVTVKIQKSGVHGDGGVYLATFVRSCAQSRCMNSEDVSELCRDVEMVHDSQKTELQKLRDLLAAVERRHLEDQESSAREQAQLATQLEDCQAKLSRSMQKNIETNKERQAVESQLREIKNVVEQLHAELEAARQGQASVDQVRRDMEKKLRYHEKQLRNWAARHAAILRENCGNVMQTFREIEGGVLDTARCNLRYANELDGLQVEINRLQPELDDARKREAEKEAEVSRLQDRVRQLEHECRLHNINRGDILAQLQDALLREGDLRENSAHLEKERSEIKESLTSAESQNVECVLKIKRLQDQVRLLESKLNDARDLDHSRQQELTAISRKLADVNEKFSSQVAKQSKDLDMAYHAARQMHLSVCRPIVGLTCGIGILVASAGKAGGCRVASVEAHASTGSGLQMGDFVIEIDGQDVQQEEVATVNDLLIGPIGSEVKIVVQRSEGGGGGIHNVTVQRGIGGATASTILPDLVREVKTMAAKLHEDLDVARQQNDHLKERASKQQMAHEDEQRKLRTIQADIQIQLDAQLRNVAEKERANRSLQHLQKESALKIDELEKLLRSAQAKSLETDDEITRLESQRDDLKSGNVAARDSLRKASADLKEMQAKLEALTEDKTELERTKRDLMSQVEDREFSVSELEKQLIIGAQKRKDLEDEISRLAKENKALASAAARDRESMEDQIQALMIQVRELQESLSDTAARYDDSERNLRSLDKRNEDRQAAIEDLEKRLKASQAKVHQLVDELAQKNNELNQAKDAAFEDSKNKQSALLKVQAAMDAERARTDELTAKLAESDKAKTALKSKVSVLEPTCNAFEKKLGAAEARELEMKEEIRRLLEEVFHLKSNASGTIGELQEQIAKLRSELTASKNELATVQEKLAEAERINKALKSEAVEYEGKIGALEKQHRADTQRLQDLESRLKELHEQSEKWEERSHELEQAGTRKDTRISELEEEASRLRALLDEGGNSTAEMKRRLKQASERIDDLEQELRRANKEINDMQKQLKMLEDQRDKLLALQDDLMKRISVYESRRQNAKDTATMTDAPKPVPAATLKKPDPPKLCGLGMRVTEVAPHRIVELIEGGAAKESKKLIVGDHILSIAGKETEFLSMNQVRDLIVGPAGSVVKIKVSRKGHDVLDKEREEVFDLELTRAELKSAASRASDSDTASRGSYKEKSGVGGLGSFFGGSTKW